MSEERTTSRFEFLLQQLKEEHELAVAGLPSDMPENGKFSSESVDGAQQRALDSPAFLVGKPAASASWRCFQQHRAPSKQPGILTPVDEKPSAVSFQFSETGSQRQTSAPSALSSGIDLDKVSHEDTSGGFSKCQLTSKPYLWARKPELDRLHTDMISNFGLRKCPSLRERAQIRLAAVGVGGQALKRRCSWLVNIGQFSQRNPLTTLDNMMAIFIVCNSIAIGMSCDTADWSGWVAVDIFFASVFALDMALRWWILGLRIYFCGSQRGWHWCEFFLVLLSIFELGFYASNVASAFRIFRLVRLIKMVRVCRLTAFKDLVMMFNGTIGGLRTLFWSVFLISIPLYLVALVFRESLGQEPTAKDANDSHPSTHFATLGESFFTVFRCIIVGDCADENGAPIFVLVSRSYSRIYTLIYCGTFIFMILGLCNVIVAIYVENTVAAAKWDDRRKKEDRLRDHHLFREKGLELSMLVYCLYHNLDPQTVEWDDVDLGRVYDLEISEEEFVDICGDTGFCKILDDLDIAREDHPVLFDTLDTDRGGTLDMHELLAGVAKLRGEIRKSDVVAIMLGVRQLTRLVKAFRNEFSATKRLQDYTSSQKFSEKSVKFSDAGSASM